MKEVNHCLVCGSTQLKTFRAKVNPFIAERVWGRGAFDVKLLLCNNCTFAFYNPRLEDNEIEILYSNYRDDLYQKQRAKIEPWYTKEIISQIGNNPTELHSRKSNLTRLLSKYIDISAIKSVLDFGGDKGQFIPDELEGADRYVYEISGVEPLKGIKLVRNLSECKSRAFDLIMCCHVLEHCSYPVNIIDEIRQLSNNRTIIYIEVPFDSPFYAGGSEKLQNGLRLIKRNPIYLFKIIQGIIQLRPGTFYMGEHVNFFTQESLEVLLKMNGFAVIANEIRLIDNGWTKGRNISCLSRPADRMT